MEGVTFKELKKQSNKELEGKPINLAILSDTTNQFLDVAIRGTAVIKKINIKTFLGGYGEFEQIILNPNSKLLSFKPDFVLLYFSSLIAQQEFYAEREGEREMFSKKKISRIISIVDSIIKQYDSEVLLFNFPEISDGIYGNYGSKLKSSLLFQIGKLNGELRLLASNKNEISLVDLSSLVNYHGQKEVFDSKLLVNAGVELKLELLPALAGEIVNIIATKRGKVKKCLILDLDNTLWGGVIGDDGIDGIHLGVLGIGKAFVRFQYWIKELKNRGIILAVCSKNDELTAKEPFLHHPDMILKLEDIAIFIANWKDKVENIRKIQSVLNIGFDSMVFLDDNPVEREWVRKSLPDVEVPELPADPADYLFYVQSNNLFETSGISHLDKTRTFQYQQEAKRESHREEFGNYNEYLESLEMEASLEILSSFNMPRLAQLSQRSNQFNFRTVRYSEADLLRISQDKKYIGFGVNLRDKFGDYGLVGLVILKLNGSTLFIENWLMSCRVFNRNLEYLLLSQMVEVAKSSKCNSLVGEFIRTPKNNIIQDFYKERGFTNIKGKWWLDVEGFNKESTSIKLKTKKINIDDVA